MDSLALRVEHQACEVNDEPSPLGEVRLEQGESSAVLLTPSALEPGKHYPLFTVLHGAGRQDAMLTKACKGEPDRRDAFFLIPRSVDPTWDLIVGGEGKDLDFLAYAYGVIYRNYPIDPERQAVIGYSDGASYGLSLALSNPRIFDAALCWAAGFVMLDREAATREDPKPSIYLEYGTHDELFPFERIALPIKENLLRAGYSLEFSVDEGGRHWPSGSFQGEALDWYFSR
jgi:phospholipase/carboxylesterase